jgi:hypothetical protein
MLGLTVPPTLHIAKVSQSERDLVPLRQRTIVVMCDGFGLEYPRRHRDADPEIVGRRGNFCARPGRHAAVTNCNNASICCCAWPFQTLAHWRRRSIPVITSSRRMLPGLGSKRMVKRRHKPIFRFRDRSSSTIIPREWDHNTASCRSADDRRTILGPAPCSRSPQSAENAKRLQILPHQARPARSTRTAVLRAPTASSTSSSPRSGGTRMRRLPES